PLVSFRLMRVRHPLSRNWRSEVILLCRKPPCRWDRRPAGPEDFDRAKPLLRWTRHRGGNKVGFGESVRLRPGYGLAAPSTKTSSPGKGPRLLIVRAVPGAHFHPFGCRNAA